MNFSQTASILALASSLAMLVSVAPAFGQSTPAGNEIDSSDPSPQTRLRQAEKAFRNGNFGEIPPLLDPLLGKSPAFDSGDAIIRARELLGVGLYFEAQETTDSAERDKLIERARTQFLELLRRRPDYRLDSLMFPASVVELFESVRRANADELDKLQETSANGGSSSTGSSAGGTEQIYIERIVRERVYAVNFLPLGAGQFQNNQPLLGSLFAGGQVVSGAVIALGFWRIESLRLPNGKFRNPRACNNCTDLRDARSWRTAQWVGLGTLGVLYVGSVVDALLNYRRIDDVRIRMRDTPPPELSLTDSPAGNGPVVQLGFGSVHIRW